MGQLLQLRAVILFSYDVVDNDVFQLRKDRGGKKAKAYK